MTSHYLAVPDESLNVRKTSSGDTSAFSFRSSSVSAPDADADYLCELYLFINAQDSLVRYTVPRVADIPMCPHAPEYTRRDYESGYAQYDPLTRVLRVGGVRVMY